MAGHRFILESYYYKDLKIELCVVLGRGKQAKIGDKRCSRQQVTVWADDDKMSRSPVTIHRAGCGPQPLKTQFKKVVEILPEAQIRPADAANAAYAADAADENESTEEIEILEISQPNTTGPASASRKRKRSTSPVSSCEDSGKEFQQKSKPQPLKSPSRTNKSHKQTKSRSGKESDEDFENRMGDKFHHKK